MTNEAEDQPRRRRRAPERPVRPAEPKPQPKLRFPPVNLISADELESIHRAALKVLREIGMDILHAEAKALLKDAGADVSPSSDRVRFAPELVESRIGLAPKIFTLHARNPARNVEIGGPYTAFCSVASTPNSF